MLNLIRQKDSIITLHLGYRQPFNWLAGLDFLEKRAIPGVEQVLNGCYQRTIQIAGKNGILAVSLGSANKNRPLIQVKIIFPESAYLYLISEKVKKLFDLEAPAHDIDLFLSRDLTLKKSIQENRGLRVPGCWDPFELCVRAILGQQISVKGATTISGRIVEKFGQTYDGPVFHKNPKSWFIFPGPEVLKEVDLAGLGLTKSRMHTIQSLASAFHRKDIRFDHSMENETILEKLKTIKGIGEWTAQYIAMRVLRDPDAFPASDLGLIKAISPPGEKVKPKDLLKLSQNWSPWRATAAMYLWRSKW